MRRFSFGVFLAALLFPLYAPAAAVPPFVHHHLVVRLDPAGEALEAKDTISLLQVPRSGMTLEFRLHDGLDPTSLTEGVVLDAVSKSSGEVPTAGYRLSIPAGVERFDLAYRGRIHHALAGVGEEYARGQQESPGIISAAGVFLSAASLWYPAFDAEFLTFDLEVRLPRGWEAVSQGKRVEHRTAGVETLVRWEAPDAQEEIYLVAGTYSETTRRDGEIEAMVFLREPDPPLAEKFLQATFQYLRMYADLIGPYPYPKFALVENFWETGYGMPSFTLLGPRVLRFPFILTSSYPHEILHNWWGSGVAIDYEKGNWGEGLTAYLSDHLLKEQQGNGAEYRLGTLQKYADYVLSGRDLPLTDFRSRRGSVTEAVGYGKALMFFHMLRRKLGDEPFRRGLQAFYRDHRHRTAGFEDLRLAFQTAGVLPVAQEFVQWVTRPGAPQLSVTMVEAAPEGKEFLLRIDLQQTQGGDPYRLGVPVAVTLEGRDEAFLETALLDGARAAFELRLPARPLRVDIDPEYDLFRRLDRREIPPALTQAFGAERAVIVLPAAAPATVLKGYRELAEAIRRTGPGAVEILEDAALAELPPDRSPWILGWENKFLPEARRAVAAYDAEIGDDAVRLETESLPRRDHAFALAGRHPRNDDLALLWIGADDAAAIPGLGRKLPHYHKYSYLGFAGPEPENVAKGRWPVIDSPLSVAVPKPDGARHRVEMGKLPKRQPLIALPSAFSEERLQETVNFLASADLQGRGFGSEGLKRAATFIAAEFAAAGLVPAGDGEGSYFQAFSARGGDPEREALLENVLGVIPGTNPAMAGESVVVAAHYDHLGLGWPDAREGNRGQIHPGADDNASGVAVLLELARVIGRAGRPERTVVFAAFAGEDYGRLGSRHFCAAEKRYAVGKCIGMINLDSVGRPRKKQLLVLGGASAAEWVHIFRGASYATGIETVVTAAAVDASDQVSFHEAGVPAVQLTTGPHADYHRPTDTAEKVDASWLTGVTAVVKEAVEYLGGRKERLTSTSTGTARDAGAAPPEGRKVSLGTVPDFTHPGPGVRLEDVVPDSPAAKAGLRAGDVLVRVNGAAIRDLKGLSEMLKSLAAGAVVDLVVRRDAEERNFKATLEKR